MATLSGRQDRSPAGTGQVFFVGVPRNKASRHRQSSGSPSQQAWLWDRGHNVQYQEGEGQIKVSGRAVCELPPGKVQHSESPTTGQGHKQQEPKPLSPLARACQTHSLPASVSPVLGGWACTTLVTILISCPLPWGNRADLESVLSEHPQSPGVGGPSVCVLLLLANE